MVSSPVLRRVSECIHMCILDFLSRTPLMHVRAVCEGIDSPQGSYYASPCMDQIDTAGLNIALWQGGKNEAILGSVYAFATWDLPQMNDQMKVRKGQGTLNNTTLMRGCT